MDIVYPRIEREVITRTYGRFLITPLERGFGITVGNALRRVLLSSLQGAAVTSVRVTGIHHEFSPIPGAKEDMIQFILNVKQLRLKSFTDDKIRLRLTARGEGAVTAADIQAPSQVEIVNPELHMLTLDSEDAEVEIEMSVEKGRGYSPADERSRLPIDEIPVDAIFSPIRSVRYDVERVRYGVERERTGSSADYDQLVLQLWTDGTVRPDEALTDASKILMRHFQLTADTAELLPEPKQGDDSAKPALPDSVASRPIDELGLQVRAYNCLKRAGITTIGEVLEKLKKGRDEMLAIRNFGEKSLDELIDALNDKGYEEYLLQFAGEGVLTNRPAVTDEENQES